ncbi:hypothetical protein K3495_g4268 [Podosphaera aphanis]|nr:hypothetical protein K3495_g4268 [Podosphaera aphanis]
MPLPGHNEQGVARKELPINTKTPPNDPVNDEQNTVENNRPQTRNIVRNVPTPEYKKVTPFSILLMTLSYSQKDANGDVKLTGIFKIRPKWVLDKEIERRRKEGLCIRCGNKGHHIARCHFLPPERSEIAVKSTSMREQQIETGEDCAAQDELLKVGITKAKVQTNDDLEAAGKMDGNSFIKGSLINRIYPLSTMMDTGRECLAAVGNFTVRKAGLPRISIAPRKLTGATTSDEKGNKYITEMTKMEFDIDGYRKTLFAYIIPRLSHEMILGKPWMEREDVVYHAKRHLMDIREATINDQPLRVWEKELKSRYQEGEGMEWKVNAIDCSFVDGSPKDTCSFEEINSKFGETTGSGQRLLRFPHDKPTDKLPPHRLGCGHEIKLEPDKEIPWGPLYGVSRDELLVLRKTLTELLDKNYIRASSSPAGASVLFVRKPGGGLRFCVDYRALNAISKADRYPLPLIKKIPSKLRKSKWFTKLDFRVAFRKLELKETSGNHFSHPDGSGENQSYFGMGSTTYNERTKKLSRFSYRGFIDGNSKICAPLTPLTGKGTPWKWDSEERQAFETLKAKFAAEPALAQWDPDRSSLFRVCPGWLFATKAR